MQTCVILDKIPLGIIVFSQNFKITKVNQTAEEYITKTDNCLLDIVKKMVSDTYTNNRQVQKNIGFSDHYSMRVWNVQTELLKTPPQIMVIIRDETNCRQLEQTIIKAERLAVAGYSAISSLMEIRNPLTGARGFCQLMGYGDKIKQDYITIITRELEEIQNIIENYKNISELSAAINIESIYDKVWRYIHGRVDFHKLMMVTDVYDNRLIDGFSEEQIHSVLESIRRLNIWSRENIYIIDFEPNTASGPLKLNIYLPRGINKDIGSCGLKIDNCRVNMENVNDNAITLEINL